MIPPYKIVASGSEGNATIIDYRYMIDCGVSRKALEPYMDKLTIVFLTHTHSDHFNRSTIKWLAENRPMLRFAGCTHMVKDLVKCGVPYQRIDILHEGFESRYSSIAVSPFHVTHDVPNCGYKIETPIWKIFYATDCANLKGIEAKDYDLYLIEANHKTADIDAKIAVKKERLEYSYERRAKEMHLSEEDANEWLMKNMGTHSTFVYMHQHQERRSPCHNP